MSDPDSGGPTTDEEPEFNVERILFQSQPDGDGEPMYLVKWRGYGDEQCTWEPADHFWGQRTLVEWEQQRELGDYLDEEALAMVQARMKAFKEAEERKIRRKALRQIGKGVSSRKSKSETPKSSSPTKRRTPLPTRDQRPSKRRRPTPSPTFKKEDPQGSGVTEADAVQQPAPPNPTVTEGGSALVTSEEVGTSSPSASTGPPDITKAPSPLQVARGSGVSRPIPRAKEGDADIGADRASSTPAAGKKTGTARAHAASIATSIDNSKAGQRFKNLRQQNQLAKKARRERTPDSSKLDLKEPDAWPGSESIGPVSKSHDAAPKFGPGDSPLFVPENSDADTELPQIEDLQTRKKGPTGSTQSPLRDLTPVAIEASSSIPTAFSTPGSPNAAQGSLKRARRNTTETRLSTIRTKSRDSIPSTAPNAYAERRPPPSQPRSNSTNISPAPRHNDGIVTSTQHKNASSIQPQPVHGPFTPNFSTESMTSKPGRTTTRTSNNGRAFDLDIFLRFENHDVGIVTLIGIPRWLSGKLQRTAGRRSARPLKVEFKEQYVMDPQRFEKFSAMLHWQPHGTYSIQASGDRLRKAEELSKFLQDNKLVAAWECPLPRDSLILVMSSSRAPGSRGLGEGTVGGAGTPLQVVVRNKQPGVYFENDPASPDYFPQSMSEQDIGLPVTEPNPPRLALRLHEGDDAGVYTQNPVRLSAASPTPGLANEDTDSVRSRVQSPVETPTSTPRTATRVASEGANPAQAGLSISQLAPIECLTNSATAIPPVVEGLSFSANFEKLFGDVDISQRRPRVMICFGKTKPSNAAVVRKWLHTHMSPRQVFIDSEKDDWEEFQDGLSNKVAALLFHEQHREYCDLRNFYKILQTPYVFCYEMSFSCPFPRPKLDQGSPLPMLFPLGTVVCITEDTLIRHPEEASWVMKWFELQSADQPYWKLALLPDVVSWLLRMAKQSRGAVSDEYISIVQSVNRLNSRSLEALWNNIGRNKDLFKDIQIRPWDHSSKCIQSPSALPILGDWDSADFSDEAVKARDKDLVKSFVEWAATHSRTYRRFFVLDSTHNNTTEQHSWHVSFREPKDFKKDVMTLEMMGEEEKK